MNGSISSVLETGAPCERELPTNGGGHANASASGFCRRTIAIIFAVMLLPLLPFAFHRSTEPVWHTYSASYAVLLVGLVFAAGLVSVGMGWLFRKASRERQAPFVLLALGSVAMGLFCLELWLGFQNSDAFARYRAWGHTRSALLGFEAAPNNRWSIAGATYTTDAQTFRSHTTPRVSPDEETLIVVMGGSAVFGYGLNDDETWASSLEKRLRERFGSSVTVLNAGCNGHNTLQQMIRAHMRVLPLKPDFIVHYGAINDVRPDAARDQLIIFPEELVHATTTRDYLRIKNQGKGFYFENSLLFNRIGQAMGLFDCALTPRYRPKIGGSTVDTFVATTEIYLRNMASLQALCETNGVAFVPVTFLADTDSLPPPFHRGVEQYVKALRDQRCERGLPMIDLLPDFKRIKNKADLFFKDHYHPNRRGAAFLAEHIGAALESMLASHFASQVHVAGQAALAAGGAIPPQRESKHQP